MMCFNRKVLLGLAAVAGGIWLLAPEAFGAAVPILVLLACPLSMLLMMRGMAGGQHGATATSDAGSAAVRSGTSDDEELIRLRAEIDQLKAGLRDRQSRSTRLGHSLEP